MGTCTIVRAQHIAALVALLAFGSACGAGPEERLTEPSSEQLSETPGLHAVDSSGGDPAPTGNPEQSEFAKALARIHEKHRNAEGREGILAEERLYSNFDEELIIRDFFRDRRGGFYLDVGCARPVRGSNTYYLEKHLGWRGIGIDALEEFGPAWKEMRPESLFLTYLVTDQSGATEKFFRSFGRGFSSTDQEWASGKAFGNQFRTEEVQVEAITLDDLLDREGVTKIDLLSMDIEGHEPKALAGFDIERFQPELVVIEGQVKTPNQHEVSSYFERHGYELIQKYRPFDTVNDYYKPKGR